MSPPVLPWSLWIKTSIGSWRICLAPEVAIDSRLHFLASVEMLGFLFISQKIDESASTQIIHHITKMTLTTLPPHTDDKYFGLLGIQGEATIISISKEWFKVTDPPFSDALYRCSHDCR